MDFIDRRAYMSLHQLGDGRAIYYPSVPFVSGYLLTSESQQQQIRPLLKMNWLVGTAFLITFFVLIWKVPIDFSSPVYLVFFALAIVLDACYRIALHEALNSLHPAPERVKRAPFRDSFIRNARAAKVGGLCFTIFAGLLMTAACVCIVIGPASTYGELVGVAGLILFGGLTAVAVCAIAIRIINPHTPSPSGL